MSRWPLRCLGWVIVCALTVSVHGQGRTRDGAVKGGPAPAAPPAQAAPAGGAVTVQIYPQVMHIRFPKAVTAPQALNEVQDVRAHLESPILATVPGSTKKAVILPSNIDVNLDIKLTDADSTHTNARMQLRIASANVDPAEGRRRFGSAEVTHDFIGWPKPGDVLIPAGTTLSIPQFARTDRLSQAALAATDPNENRAEESYPSHPILGNVTVRIALVDVPIDVNNVASNKLFRAQLTEDMQSGVTGGPPPLGAIALKKGADVYLRSYEPDPSAPLGHFAVWSVDFVVVDGKRIPVKGLGMRQPFAPGSMAITPDGKGRMPMVLWPLNQPRVFNIIEQQEVSANATPLWTYPTTTEVMTPGSTPATAPQTSSSTGRATAPPASGAPNAPAAGAPVLPADVQRQLDEARKRAEDQRACQQKATTDHARDPLGLAKALQACRDAARGAAPPRR